MDIRRRRFISTGAASSAVVAMNGLFKCANAATSANPANRTRAEDSYTLKKMGTIPLSGVPSSIRWSEDKSCIAATTKFGSAIEVFEVGTLRRRPIIEKTRSLSKQGLWLSETGDEVYSFGPVQPNSRGPVIAGAWDTYTGQLRHSYLRPNDYYLDSAIFAGSITTSADREYLLVTSEGREDFCVVFHRRSGDAIKIIRGGEDLSFSHISTGINFRLAVSSVTKMRALARTPIYILNIESGRRELILDGHLRGVAAFDFHQTSGRLVSSAPDQMGGYDLKTGLAFDDPDTLRIWDTETGSKTSNIHQSGLSAKELFWLGTTDLVAYNGASPNGQKGRCFALIDPMTSKILLYQEPDGTRLFDAVAVTSDGSRCALASGAQLDLYNIVRSS